MRSRTQELAAELKQVIRLAARDPEALEGALAALSSFQRVVAAGQLDEAAQVHFILYRLVPEYAARLPSGRDGRAIRELLTWEDADGDAQSLTTRYHRASAHLLNAADDFGRRQEPRLLLECARRFIALDHEDRLATVEHAAPAASAPPETLMDDPHLSPLAPLLWTKAEEDHSCLTGWLGEEGYSERSLVYVRELDPVRSHYADMLRVEEHVTVNRYDQSIREMLASHDDPPLSASEHQTHPPWSPLAPPG